MYHDALQGFAVRVTDTGTKTFCAYCRIRNGPPRVVRIGPYPGMKIHEARELAKNTVAAMLTGTDPNAEKVKARQEAERAHVTLQQLLDDYLATKRLKPNTVKDYQLNLSKNFPDWLERPYNTITEDDVVRRFAKVTRRSPPRANSCFRVLRTLLNFAEVRYKTGIRNPVAVLGEMKLWNKNKRKQSFISAANLAPWFTAVLECQDDTARDLMLFLILTGCRTHEGGMSLEWSRVDLKDKSYKLMDTKSGADLVLPLCDYLVKMLKRREKAAKNKFVFPSAIYKDKHVKDIDHWITQVKNKSGVQFTLYDLRRTFSTHAESLDMSPYTLKRLMGHTVNDKDVTGGYVVPNVDRLRAACKAVTDLVLNQCGAKHER